jgi:peptidoglycan-associated lipoprotein
MKSTVLAVFVSCGVLAACGSDPVPPPNSPPPAPAPAEPVAPPQKAGDDGGRGDIQIDPEIKKACGITDAEAYFAFDSANIREPDRVVLKKLAVCFSTGPLAGRQMRLVGHADPRGDEEYNRVLGQRRADNVKGAIASQGLDSAKMVTTSRGEDDATGTDENTWSRDRRVDIMLGQ